LLLLLRRSGFPLAPVEGEHDLVLRPPAEDGDEGPKGPPLAVLAAVLEPHVDGAAVGPTLGPVLTGDFGQGHAVGSGGEVVVDIAPLVSLLLEEAQRVEQRQRVSVSEHFQLQLKHAFKKDKD
jgi:hypothetical protein